MVLFFTCTNRDDLKRCALLVDNGSIIVFPTDTVYGIGCDPFNESSVLNLYKIKNRPLEKHLPVLTNNVSNLSNLVEISDKAEKLMKNFWPGPLTLILKVKDDCFIPHRYAFNKTIAIRIPNNKCTLNLIELTKNKLLVGTSANLSKQSPFSSIREIKRTGLQGYDAIVIKDEESQSLDDLQTYLNSTTTTTTIKNIESVPISNSNTLKPSSFPVSTIVDLANNSTDPVAAAAAGRSIILREGVISKEQIFSILD